MENRITTFNHLNKVALKIALGSFALGSLILLTALAVNGGFFIGIGLIFIMLALVANLILFFIVIINLVIMKDKKQSLFTLYCILINIPIAIGYVSLLDL